MPVDKRPDQLDAGVAVQATDIMTLNQTALPNKMIQLPVSALKTFLDSYYVGSLPVENTVYVDEVFGNNTTALCQRMDKPFQTKAAALAACLTFFTGYNTPSATVRKMIVVRNTYSSEGILYLSAVAGIDWDLSGGSINFTGGTGAIYDGNFAVDTIIYNANAVKGTTARGIRTQNAGSVMTLYAKTLSATGTYAAECLGGTQIVTAELSGSAGAFCSGTTQTIRSRTRS